MRERALVLLLLGGASDDASVAAALEQADAETIGALLDAASRLADGELSPALYARIERNRSAREWPLRMRAARVLPLAEGARSAEPVALVRTPPPPSPPLTRCVESSLPQTSN